MQGGQQGAKDVRVSPSVVLVGSGGDPPPTGQEKPRLPVGERAAVSSRRCGRRGLGGSLPATTNAISRAERRKTLPDRLSPWAIDPADASTAPLPQTPQTRIQQPPHRPRRRGSSNPPTDPPGAHATPPPIDPQARLEHPPTRGTEAQTSSHQNRLLKIRKPHRTERQNERSFPRSQDFLRPLGARARQRHALQANRMLFSINCIGLHRYQ